MEARMDLESAAPKNGNCLICNDYFSAVQSSTLNGLNSSQLPAGGNDTYNGSDHLLPDWKTAFQLFSKLLTGLGQRGTGEDVGFDLAVAKILEKSCSEQALHSLSPCCSGCSALLVEIVKLQKMIEENQRMQLKQVDMLRSKLRSNYFSQSHQDFYCLGIDDENDNERSSCNLDFRASSEESDIKPDLNSLESIDSNIVSRSTTTGRKRGRPPRSRTLDTSESTSLEALKWEHVGKKSLDEAKKLKESRFTAREELSEQMVEWILPEFENDTSDSGEPTPSTDEENISNEDENPIPGPAKPQRLVSKHRQRKENLAKGSTANVGVSVPAPPPAGNHRMARSNLFLLVQENFLFHKNTVIEVFHRQKMICREANCNFIVEGIDFLAFEKIRQHVKSHVDEPDYSRRIRQCPVCQGEFLGMFLKPHLLQHHQPVNTVCEICWKLLKALEVKTHQARYHNEGKIESTHPKKKRKQPNKSIKTFMLVEEDCLLFMKTFVKVSHSESLQCEDCSWKTAGTTYDSFQEMKKHITNVHSNSVKSYNNKRRRCPICSNSYAGWILKGHLLQSHQIAFRHLCEVCGKRFNCAGHVKCHMWLHKSEDEKDLAISLGEKDPTFRPCKKYEEYPCSTCRRTFSRLRDLKSHETRHELPLNLRKQFECKYCHEKLASNGSLHAHIARRHQPDSAKRWRICGVCGKRFYFRETLRYKMHMRLHAEGPAVRSESLVQPEQRERRKEDEMEATFLCSTCGKGFKVKALLQRHELKHLPLDERNMVECEYCQIKLVDKRSLRNHIEKLHRPDLDSNPRICHICNKRFHRTDKAQFETHMLSHSNERPFVCEICGVSFLAKRYLQDHMKDVHTEKKQFQCELCEAAYNQKRSLARHRRTDHKDLVGEVPLKYYKKKLSTEEVFFGPKIAYPCDLCNVVCPLPCRLIKHQEIHGIFKGQRKD